MVAPIGVKFCVTEHISSGQVSPFEGGTPRGFSKYKIFCPPFWLHSDSDTHQHEILHDDTCVSQMCLFPFWGWYPERITKIYNFGPLKSEYLEDCKSQRYMSIGA